MTNGALVAVAIGLMVISAATGAIAVLIASTTSFDQWTAFGWGAVLGPIGIVVVLVETLRRRRTTELGETSSTTWT